MVHDPTRRESESEQTTTQPIDVARAHTIGVSAPSACLAISKTRSGYESTQNNGFEFVTPALLLPFATIHLPTYLRELI